MRSLRLSGLAATFFACILGAALQAATPESSPKPEPRITALQGLPETEGRQLFVGDEAGNAYVVQLADRRIFRVDDMGHARLHSRLESESAITGALRAATGDEGNVWLFGFAPHIVRVFENGEEVDIEQPGAIITGMTVTGGRPTLSLAAVIPEIGADVGRDSPLPEIPPLVVQLGEKGEWVTWIERDAKDWGGDDITTVGILGFETRLDGDEQGRLLMARRYRYDVREYKPGGRMTDRLLSGEVEFRPIPEEIAERLEQAGRRVDRSKARPKSAIEGVAWSPEGEVLILATTKDGYALDRWLPALQEHQRLPLQELEKASRLQMVATRNGLLFLPAMDATRLLFVPWDFLRDAEWESLQDDEAPEGSASEEAG
jgi:hypothetical protein